MLNLNVNIYSSIPLKRLNEVTVFFKSMAIVIGPTPPGTGVIALAFADASSKSTSPTNLPSTRLIPTSITIAPDLTIAFYQFWSTNCCDQNVSGFGFLHDTLGS